MVGNTHLFSFLLQVGREEGARGVKMWRSFFNYLVGLWAVFLFYLNFHTFWTWKTWFQHMQRIWGPCCNHKGTLW
jgi:hypothetical protein